MAAPTSSPPSQSPPGIFQSLKKFLATWVDLLRTRLDLISTELEEEREWLQQIVILGAAAFLCLAFGVFLVTLFVVVFFWDSNYRLVVLGGLALIYLAAGIVLASIARRKSQLRPKLFSASLGELDKDYRRLSS